MNFKNSSIKEKGEFSKKYKGNYISLRKNYLKRSVASNPNTSLNFLEKLSVDKSSSVRTQVAFNKNCPIEILNKLSEDDDFVVRYMVARNKNCSILVSLFSEEKPFK